MADIAPTSEGDPATDFAEHERTYALFIEMTKWTAIVSIAILVILAWLTL